MSKKVNLQIVTKVATELASLKTDITTLEVKKELRSRGYYVSQTEVSDFMAEMFEDPNQNNWDFTTNGSYRTYSYHPSFRSSLTGPKTTTTLNTKSNNSVLNLSFKGKKRPVLTPLSKPVIGCWKVERKKSSSSPCLGFIYYDSKETRDAVRCDYAKRMKTSFNDVRAKKVK